jgi:signal transduction histidine kinase
MMIHAEEGTVLEQPAVSEAITPVVLADGRRAHRRDLEPSRRVLARFGISTALALMVILVAGLVFSSRAAEREGVADVRRLTHVLAHSVVEPNLTAGLLAGDDEAVAAMDDLVKRQLAESTDLVRVKLWAEGGRIVYSDEGRLIGTQYAFGDEELAALKAGTTDAEVSDLGRSENRFERNLGGRLLEVYSGVQAPDGTRLLFETYFSFDVVHARRTVLLWSFASITLVGLFVFAAFQLSLGYTTVRWLQRERERLLEKAVRVSEDERRRLAADLHDGIVQDLVGAAYVVTGTSAELRRRREYDECQTRLSSAADSIRTSVQGLRSMIVDLYPASLGMAGLHVAMSDLVAPLRSRGMSVDLFMPEELRIPEHVQALLYRISQEAVRNIVRHAQASSVSIHVEGRHGRTVLSITDDGTGFTPGGNSVPGHIGLRTMADLAQEAGALLEITSAPGRGTAIVVELPS